MARFIVWLICCLTLMGAYGQTRDTLYVDEGYVTLERTEFDNKLDSDLYYQIIYDLDSVLLKKLFLNYYLGRLQPKKKSQLFGLLTQRNQMDTTQTMLIHYQDTLKRKEFYPKKSLIVYLENGKHRHIPSYRAFLKGYRKCVKNYSKETGIQVYHYFHFNEGHPQEYKDIRWYADPLNVLRKMFYNKGDNTRDWRLFLFPNGDYMLLFGPMPREMYEDLKAHRNWDQHLQTFREQYQTVNPEIDLGASGGK